MSLRDEPYSEPLHILVSNTLRHVSKTVPSVSETPTKGKMREAQRGVAGRDVTRFSEAVMHQVNTMFLRSGC